MGTQSDGQTLRGANSADLGEPAPESEATTDAGPPEQADLLGIKAFIPVPLEVIPNTDSLPFHVYIRHPDRGYVPFRFAGTSLGVRERSQLVDDGERRVFVDVRQHDLYCRYVEDHLDSIIADGAIDVVERARLLYEMADRLVEEMAVDLCDDHVKRSRRLIRVLASHTLHSRVLPEAMANVRRRERHPGAHVLAVTGGLMRLGLAMKLPMNQLGEVALGGMLHDVGKDSATLAAGTIDGEDYRAHPSTGGERLRALLPRSPGIVAMAEQHHERVDGRGFPRELKGGEIHAWARMLAIVDAFDNLVHQASDPDDRLAPQAAIEKMLEEAGQAWDPEMLGAWKRQVVEAPAGDGGGNEADTGPFGLFAGPGGKERRRHLRYPFHVALVLNREQASGGRRKTLVVQSLDISRGGVHFISKQPLSRGERVIINIPTQPGTPAGPTRAVQARIVRCDRSMLTDGFDVGAEFLGT